MAIGIVEGVSLGYSNLVYVPGYGLALLLDKLIAPKYP